MAFNTEASVVIDRPPEVVWAYLNDYSATEDWRSVRKLHALGEGPIGVGTRFEGTVVMAGKEYPYVNELTEFQPPSRQSWRSVSGSGWFKGREGSYVLEPHDGGTRLTYKMTFEPISRAGTLVEKPAALLLRKLGWPQMVIGIKKAVEGQPAKAAQGPS